MSVFAWGLGKNGQLGQGIRENSNIPVRIFQFCHEHTKGASRPKQTSEDSGNKNRHQHRKAVCITAGGLTTGFLRNGEVYFCGSGAHGRLGTSEDSDCLKPVKVAISGDDVIVAISGGIWHGAAVTSRGTLYTWGYNKSHGVLGLQPAQQGSFLGPSMITSLPSTKIIGISCGNNYTLSWDDQGNLFSWGCGRHGTLGFGNEEDKFELTHVKDIEEKVVFADAGFAHCGIVTESGNILMAGKGEYGALGFGSTSTKGSPCLKAIENKDNVHFKEVSCSNGEHHGHTLALTTRGEVYAWGDGYKGKLGLGDQESRFIPTLINPASFQGKEMLHVSAGGIHSAAVSVTGHAYTWGCGSDGRLGHPEAKGHRYLFRSDIPRLVEALKDTGKVIDIKASYYHTVALVQ